MGDRCMLGQEPDFNGFRRIVQGPDPVAIGIDTGQGQGYQRVVYLSGSHPPSNIRLRHGDSRGRFEGNSLVVETTNFSPKFPFRGAAENLKLVERFTRLDANTLEYAGHAHRPDGVDGALDRQAGADDAVGRAEPHLLRAAVPRGELRAAGAAHRRARGREGVRGRARSGSGVAGHRQLPTQSASRQWARVAQRDIMRSWFRQFVDCGDRTGRRRCERRHFDFGDPHCRPGSPAGAHRGRQAQLQRRLAGAQ